jgi:hypothetical protein
MSRIKKVFDSHQQLAHVWAQNTNREGRCSNMSFENGVIYSYGQHWPLAYIHDKPIFGNIRILLNTDSCSNSTSKHKNYVKNALSYEQKCATLEIPSVKLLISLIQIAKFSSTPSETILKELNTYYWNQYNYKCAILETMNAKYTHIFKAPKQFTKLYEELLSVTQMIDYTCNEYSKINNNYIKNVSIDTLPKLHDTLHSLYDHQKAVIKNREENKERNERKRQEQIEKHSEKVIEMWRSNADLGSYTPTQRKVLHILLNRPYIYLRVRNLHELTIETSKGARFPVSDAKSAFEIIQKCVEICQSIRDSDRPIKLGAFKIDHIDEEGNVKAGCHNVSYEEIHLIARRLGWADEWSMNSTMC